MKEIIKEGLIEIVGKENYTDQIIDLVSYSYDASEYRSRPECAVWAESTDQVSRILRLADQNRTPIVPRGAGTGLAGLSVPVKGGILLDLSRMNQIIRVSIPDRLVVVQPGVVYADLQEALVSDNFFYPPDPASGKVCTLGGNVATNAGGLRSAKYGVTRDYVLALEVVLADGEVMRIGSQTMKCSSGYDLTRLFVGSEGTLGVVTEITLKISPKPTESATAVAAFDRLEDAGEAVTLIMQSGVTPSVLELIDANTISVVRKHTDLQLPEVEAMILAETDGNTQVDVKYQMEELIAMFKRCNARNIETAYSAADAERLWLARKSLGGLVGSVSKNLASEDVTVPMGRIAEFLRKVEAISKKHNLLILNFGHAGDGNFHPIVLYDRSDPDQVNRLDQVLLELHELACKLGGTLTGEHGIGITKARFMTLEHDSVAMRVMRALKKTLDPNNILNPGKMDLDK
ncbi:MAG: FAD-linked oxidase C-terminal domain-containing protein [Desulfobacterales bacterium]